jgi:hypothetical protein
MVGKSDRGLDDVPGRSRCGTAQIIDGGQQPRHRSLACFQCCGREHFDSLEGIGGARDVTQQRLRRTDRRQPRRRRRNTESVCPRPKFPQQVRELL